MNNAWHSEKSNFADNYNDFIGYKERYDFAKANNLEDALEYCY